MSAKSSQWVDVMKARKTIFELFKNPNSIQSVVDVTGLSYSCVDNHVKKLLREYIAYSGYEIAGLKRKRDLYITIQDEFNPAMPDYVSEYLGSEAKRADLLNSAGKQEPDDETLKWTQIAPNHRRISCNRYYTSLYTAEDKRKSSKTYVGISTVYNG